MQHLRSPPAGQPHSYPQHEQPKSAQNRGGRFGTVDHPVATDVSLAGPTAADLALGAQLEAEVATASAAQERMELLSVKVAAEDLLRQWPDAAYLQMDYSDQRYGALAPAAVLDANG